MEPAPPSSLPLQIQHLPEESTAVPETDKTAAQPPSAPSPISLTTVEGTNAAKPIIMKKTNKKTISLKPRPKPSSSDSSSSAASFSQYVSRRRGIRLFRASRSLKALSGPGRPKLANVGALALPLGMSIAAVVAQVLKGKDEVDKTISADHLSQICAGAVRESLVNVYGDQFDGFLENFERSFRSTLMTLNLINKCAKDNGAKENPEIGKCFSEVSTASSPDRSEHSARCSDKECWADQILQANTMFGQPRNREQLGESPLLDYRNTQLVLHDTEIEQQMSSVFPSRNTKEDNYKSILSTLEKSLEEQARSNDLMRFKMGLTMKKMQLKERQLALSENANLLERWKLSFGFSKASFKAEKFKTQLEETRYAELLRKCIDSLVAGLLVMLACVGYGAFLYSHKRITEATASCSTEKVSHVCSFIRFNGFPVIIWELQSYAEVVCLYPATRAQS
ncbi:OLC1v1009060C2 [Oldenlandia corymbosa var. corymbosa]|uniref:OLC1v1009060C2 n=1 Tax=Oldenlandia corymbosa var. corymbosa TaxID=529605 RepID=A0AAV1DMY8_OLDCO|nr:OLC1v1009060C2 [Oldenlandia corymbosa var. corymbosa]